MSFKKYLFFAVMFVAAYSFPVERGYPSEKQVVYFGIGMRFHPITMYERYQPMMDYLTRSTQYRFELKISRDYQETIKSLIEGKTGVTAPGDGAVMEAMLLHGAVPILKPLNEEGKPYYRCYFIVPVNSPLRSLSDLKGKKVAFGSKHSTTGNLIPRYMLEQKGLRIEDLGSLTNLRNHSTVAREVLKGEYDAGAVRDSVAKNYLKHGLRILAESDELPSIPLLVRKDAPRELVTAITEALVKLDRNNPDHQKIMKNWALEFKNGFVPATAADYRDLARKFKAIPYGCGTGCHK